MAAYRDQGEPRGNHIVDRRHTLFCSEWISPCHIYEHRSQNVVNGKPADLSSRRSGVLPLGIFEINIPMLYGEGIKALTRLQDEIIKTSTDHSIFAWQPSHKYPIGSLLAASPLNFVECCSITQKDKASQPLSQPRNST